MSLSKQTPKGSLKYRMPNICEGYNFLSMVEKIENSQDLWKIKSKFIKEMSSVVDFKSIGYEDFDSFLNDKENNAAACSEIADEILSDVTGLIKKKN